MFGIGFFDHFLLAAKFGLQFNHVAVGLILVSIISILFMKRVWLASRITGLQTSGDILSRYYSSHAIRIYVFGLLILFAIPFAGVALNKIGVLLEVITDHAIDRHLAILVVGFFLFLYACIGGWRTVVLVGTVQTVVLLLLFMIFGVYTFSEFGDLFSILTTFHEATNTLQPENIFYDHIPGVLQFTNGHGKESSVGGIWTTLAILSYGVALTGIVVSPAFLFLGINSETPRGFAFQQVWVVGGLLAGLLLLLSPLLGLELLQFTFSDGQLSWGVELYGEFTRKVAQFDQFLSAMFVFMLLLSLQIGVAFFALAGANIFSIEIFARYINPKSSPGFLKLTARISLFVIFFAMVLSSGFVPQIVELFSDVTLSLAAQMIPALLGLCWLPWISRQGVIVGLIIGMIFIFFTEPMGIALFNGLFVELPWGRWPWTIHSAGWGLVFNLASCLLISGFTRRDSDRENRENLHSLFAVDDPILYGQHRIRSALWSITLIWTFFAVGPGSILGNWLFSLSFNSNVTETSNVGMPSLWVWQIVFWFLGVLILWWMAYQVRISVSQSDKHGRLRLIDEKSVLKQDAVTKWINLFLIRFSKRR
ncbi:MAG: hypothetical protein QGM50_05845 [Anaerolineae bacterium]|nr:hypothetical protein [Anaerolineae bacterium]